MADTLLTAVADGVATVTLNRPEIHNAFDDALIEALIACFAALDADDAVRVVVLAANGASFSAGADLNWMRRMAAYSEDDNIADARRLALLLYTIDRLAKPVVARVQGSAFAGALGLLAASDVVIASSAAQFAITEVRIGLIPAVISPYLLRAMGARELRRWTLLAERFDAAEAQRIGLVHEVVVPHDLDAAVARAVAALKRGSPEAMASAKALVVAVDRPLDERVIDHTVLEIAAARGSEDGVEGLTAFLEKRKPRWVTGS